ncbi:MAG: hypothetical protein AAB276_06980 [Pseudomonadota bacterium]
MIQNIHHIHNLCKKFLGAAFSSTINKKTFEEIQGRCTTDAAIFTFLNTSDESDIMDTLVALTYSKDPSYKALAVKILSAPCSVLGLSCQKEYAYKLMNLLEDYTFLAGDTFTAQEKSQILSVPKAVYGLSINNQAERLMDLILNDTTFTRKQKVQILCAGDALVGLIIMGQREDVITLLEGETFTNGEKRQILRVPHIVNLLHFDGFEERVKVLLDSLNMPYIPSFNMPYMPSFKPAYTTDVAAFRAPT